MEEGSIIAGQVTKTIVRIGRTTTNTSISEYPKIGGECCTGIF